MAAEVDDKLPSTFSWAMKASLITAVLLLLIAGCDRPQPTAQVARPVFTPNTDSGGVCGKTALTFARTLVNGDFVHAHEQLSQALRSSLSIEDLKQSYDTMLAAYETPPSIVDLTTTMEVWPDKRANDVGWAYVTIAARDWGEGIAVVVANESGLFVIRALEWGRP